jgi:hypothetical protein
MAETSEPLETLAGEDWRIIVDEADINSPTICYPDPTRRHALVGPLATVHVGCTESDEEGEEVLDLGGADGRNLVAVACLPQMVELLIWIKVHQNKLNPIHFDSQSENGRFMQGLQKRVDWILECVNDRDETMGAGEHGFERFRDYSAPAKQP